MRKPAESPSAFVDAISAQAQRYETPCGEGYMAWRCWGNGRPLVLLHGGTGSWTHWIHNVLPLAATHSVWVPDMPGYGESADPPRGSAIGALAALVADGIECLVAEPVDLAGFSFGGLVAGNLAAARPEGVRRLVLVGAGGLGLRDGKPLALVAWRHLKAPAEQLAAHRHNLASLMLADEGRIDALALYIQSENARRSRLNSGPFSRGDSLLEPLSRVQAPIAGIWGRNDSLTRERLAEVEPILRRTDSNARFQVIEDAGHWVGFEQPLAFNEALLRLVRDA